VLGLVLTLGLELLLGCTFKLFRLSFFALIGVGVLEVSDSGEEEKNVLFEIFGDAGEEQERFDLKEAGLG
jgi:hypothetical protein